MSKIDEPNAMELAPIAETRIIFEAKPQRSLYYFVPHHLYWNGQPQCWQRYISPSSSIASRGVSKDVSCPHFGHFIVIIFISIVSSSCLLVFLYPCPLTAW